MQRPDEVPARLKTPHLRDWVTDVEWSEARGERAGARLDLLARPRWAAAVWEWYSTEYLESGDLDPADTKPVERRPVVATPDDAHARLTAWCRAVGVGSIAPRWTAD